MKPIINPKRVKKGEKVKPEPVNVDNLLKWIEKFNYFISSLGNKI